MAAYFDSGFCVRKPSWHRQELLLDEYPTNWSDARTLAGLDWEPVERRVFVEHIELAAFEGRGWNGKPRFVPGPTPDGAIITDMPTEDNPFTTMHVPDEASKGIVRSDTGALLSVRPKGYPIIDNSTVGEILEAILSEGGGKVEFETAGAARGGRDVWALARLNEPITVPGDVTATYPFIVVLNSHDGSGACRVALVWVRVVCWNTFQAAISESEKSGFYAAINHVGDPADRIEAAKAMLRDARAGLGQYAELAESLIGVSIRPETVTEFLDTFIPIPEILGQSAITRRMNKRADFMALYETSPTTDEIRGTAYGLYQTVGEYLDHVRPYRSQDTYLRRTLLTEDTAKTRSLAAVRRLVGV